MYIYPGVLEPRHTLLATTVHSTMSELRLEILFRGERIIPDPSWGLSVALQLLVIIEISPA